MHEVPLVNDVDFRRPPISCLLNSDLANGFGNLAQRTLSFCAKNTAAAVPQPGELSEADEALLAHADSLHQRMGESLDVQAIHTALQHWFDLVDAANQYIADETPRSEGRRDGNGYVRTCKSWWS